MILAEDQQYLMDLLHQRRDHVQNLDRALRSMGTHAFINDGLLNEGVLKSKQYLTELDQIQRIVIALMGE
jgi:hypothetical protein